MRSVMPAVGEDQNHRLGRCLERLRRYVDTDAVALTGGVAIDHHLAACGLPRRRANYTHLEFEWEGPDLRRLWESLAERYTVVRYDGRGVEDRFQIALPRLFGEGTLVTFRQPHASIIPGAQLVMLPSGTHYFPTEAEVVTRAVAAIARFAGEPA